MPVMVYGIVDLVLYMYIPNGFSSTTLYMRHATAFAWQSSFLMLSTYEMFLTNQINLF